MARKIIGNTVGTTMKPKATGSGLPTVTEADNGKILQVVNGAWELVEIEMGVDLTEIAELIGGDA